MNDASGAHAPSLGALQATAHISSAGGPKTAAALPLLRQIQRELRRQVSEIEDHVGRIQAQPRGPSTSDAIHGVELLGTPEFEVLQGFEVINDAINAALETVETEVITAQPGGGRQAETLDHSFDREVRLLGRGVRIRTLYQHTARFSAATRYYVERVSGHGSKVRTLEEFFDRLIIVDETVAFIPCNDERSTAIAVRQPAVVRFLKGTFERSWTRATQFSVDMDQKAYRYAIDSTRLSVARLVTQGETDEVGARRAGLSLRNYREHVKALMTQLDTRSRCELGYAIARSDLLEAKGAALSVS
ncbi:helix-turn-helix transcriptional regulator [Streptomyces sp. NPDC001594]|uniref:helix-turn-helix transcriptional regulator n=1 Tax=Streptomyces sp. NPDC001594 TaxID=3364590 RepID=UPI0036B3C6A2